MIFHHCLTEQTHHLGYLLIGLDKQNSNMSLLFDRILFANWYFGKKRRKFLFSKFFKTNFI